MNIIVMKRNIVVIDMDNTIVASDVNKSEVAIAISNLTGIEASGIIIELEVDENGYVVRVIVVLSDNEECEQVVAAINDLDKGDDCELSILCHSQDARVVVDISLSSRICVHYALMFCVLVLTLAIN